MGKQCIATQPKPGVGRLPNSSPPGWEKQAPGVWQHRRSGEGTSFSHYMDLCSRAMSRGEGGDAPQARLPGGVDCTGVQHLYSG